MHNIGFASIITNNQITENKKNAPKQKLVKDLFNDKINIAYMQNKTAKDYSSVND